MAAAQAEWRKHTHWREGALFAVLAQGFLPDAPEVQRTLARVYPRRRELLENALREEGARDAAGLAVLAMAALEGGMIQAAAVREVKPLLMAADRAAKFIEAACT